MSCRRIAQQLKNWVVSDNQWRSAADDANLWLAAVNARTATKWVSVTSWDNQFRSVNSSRRNGKKGQVLLMITKHENNIPLLHDQVTPKMTLILYSTEEIEWNQITHSWASQQIMSYRHRISDGTRIRSPVWGTKHKTAQKIKIYVRFICQILAGTVCTWDFKKYSVHTYIQHYQMSFHDFHRIFFWTFSHIQSSRLPSGLAYN